MHDPIMEDENNTTDDILHDIDEDQLGEYNFMLRRLGAYPDKVIINTLSMIAEDYSMSFPHSCTKIYHAIRDLLLSRDVKPDCKLPLVYVIDSILKNVKGLYIDIMKKDIHTWMQHVYDVLYGDETSRTRLRKVWDTWYRFQIFTEEEWKDMGQCFLKEDVNKSAKEATDAQLSSAGIERAPDGSLKISYTLRKHMQYILDDMQADQVDELEKVSLERLADIDPNLLVNIKTAAEDAMRAPLGKGLSTGVSHSPDNESSIFLELRPPEVIERCAEWAKLDLNYLQYTNDSIRRLLQYVRDTTTGNSPVVHQGMDEIKLLGAASATASSLTGLLERFKKQDSNKGMISFAAGTITLPVFSSYYGNSLSSKTIDKSKFTTEGIKEKNESVIARLYEAGLPFVSSLDGRRFATQLELSQHLDNLFRRSQLEKTMEVRDERGWYQADTVWARELAEPSATGLTSEAQDELLGTKVDDTDPNKSVVTADESRDKCVICGINFEMHFDQDDGEWKYSNCREIEVLNDDVAEEESQDLLVHVTCHRGLGSPEFLTADQALQL
jgi:pre-mRNA cleavage complex 2 protein Pcf11